MRVEVPNNFARDAIQGVGTAASERGRIFAVALWALIALTAVGSPLALSGAETPSAAKNPVAEFRSWLSMSEEERAQALAHKPERQKRALQAKLQEYEKMDEAEREAKLTALEVRWHMRPLMEMAPSNRVERITAIPTHLRDTIAERLQHWDLLPAAARQEMLENEWTLHYFARANEGVPMPPEQILAKVRDGDRKRFEGRLERLRALPPSRRDEVARKFEEFFTLPVQERQKTLHTLDDAERKQMEAALAAFEGLTPAHRRACIENFGKFARMTADERGQFLRNVERWQSMTPEERQKWRSLVHSLPPMPPGLDKLPAPPTPMALPR
ncbi:MAG TPA: DUF3106 domain-containing protein [Methylomirabilota bacterium]|nr:DUF3106 domain-containing protein [Methylomirabilota bacterium]